MRAIGKLGVVIFPALIVTTVMLAALVTAGAQAPANTAGQAPVTFTKDVAPILQNRCQVCHRPDTFAPMSLLTYEDARPWARSIKEKVATREMPPWYIDKNVGVRHFTNDVSLSEEEIATIVKWVDSGAAKGNPADMPPPRQFESMDQWHMPAPDLIVQLPKDLIVPAKAPDRWVDVVVDPGLKEDRYLQAIETKPTKGFRVVHHAVTSLKNDEAGDPAADADPQGNFLNEYALGKNGDVFPEGAARLIKAGTKINFNVHLHSIGQETAANVALGLKFYPKGYTPNYVELTERIGRNQDVETLSCVSNYRFAWHLVYLYDEDAQPLLPAGTVLHVTSWHNNTASNKFNPDPDALVTYGQRTIDEMAFSWVSYYYLSDEEFKQQVEARKAKQRNTTN